jgi:hypothetical protein
MMQIDKTKNAQHRTFTAIKNEPSIIDHAAIA